MTSASDWKTLFHKRGTGAAVLCCSAGKKQQNSYRLVTEHNIAFPYGDGSRCFLSIFIGSRADNTPAEIIGHCENQKKFSLNFLRYRDLEIGSNLGRGIQEGIPAKHKNGIPHVTECNFSLFCSYLEVREMPGSDYYLLVGEIKDFWANPEVGRPLINNSEQWTTISKEHSVPVNYRLSSGKRNIRGS